MITLTVKTLTFKKDSNWCELEEIDASSLVTSIDIEDEELCPVREMPYLKTFPYLLTKDITMQVYSIEYPEYDCPPEVEEPLSLECILQDWPPSRDDILAEDLQLLAEEDPPEVRDWFKGLADGKYELCLKWEKCAGNSMEGEPDCFDLAFVEAKKLEKEDRNAQADC